MRYWIYLQSIYLNSNYSKSYIHARIPVTKQFNRIISTDSLTIRANLRAGTLLIAFLAATIAETGRQQRVAAGSFGTPVIIIIPLTSTNQRNYSKNIFSFRHAAI